MALRGLLEKDYLALSLAAKTKLPLPVSVWKCGQDLCVLIHLVFSQLLFRDTGHVVVVRLFA